MQIIMTIFWTTSLFNGVFVLVYLCDQLVSSTLEIPVKPKYLIVVVMASFAGFLLALIIGAGVETGQTDTAELLFTLSLNAAITSLLVYIIFRAKKERSQRGREISEKWGFCFRGQGLLILPDKEKDTAVAVMDDGRVKAIKMDHPLRYYWHGDLAPMQVFCMDDLPETGLRLDTSFDRYAAKQKEEK